MTTFHGIKEATPVQEKAMPLVRAGHDCIVKAQTGTGKTLAFLLPIIEKIKPQAAVTQALVITPTRELAIQIAKVAQSLSAAADISSLVIFGGQDIERQKQKLRRHPQLIIGTPGRLLDHLRRQTIDLSQVNKVVLDEADEMMRLGFIEDVETLLEATAADRQLMLFSATMPDRVKALSARYMTAPQNLEIKSEHVTLDAIDQVIIDTREETKIDKLCEIINQEQPYLAMVFCHTKQRAHMVTMALAARGYLVDELHGDLSQVQRTLVLKRFRFSVRRTSRRAASTSRASRMSSTTTSRTMRRATSTASGARAARGSAARPSPLSTRASTTCCAASRAASRTGSASSARSAAAVTRRSRSRSSRKSARSARRRRLSASRSRSTPTARALRTRAATTAAAARRHMARSRTSATAPSRGAPASAKTATSRWSKASAARNTRAADFFAFCAVFAKKLSKILHNNRMQAGIWRKKTNKCNCNQIRVRVYR